MPKYTPKTRIIAFWNRVKFPEYIGTNDCWEWRGGLDHDGYGRVIGWSYSRQAHRVSYALANGSLDKNLLICHHCDNRKCVNPSHLFVGTIADNIHDAVAKGRNAKGEKQYNAKLTNLNVIKIRNLHLCGEPVKELAEQFNVSKTAIRHVINRKTWKHIP